MANVFDYLKWRGDLPLSDGNLTDADAVILSRLSYLPFDGVVSDSPDSTVTVREAAERALASDYCLSLILWKGDTDLLRAVADSDRFGNMQLCCYQNIVEDERSVQFSAVIITINERLRFLSFRGTDNTLVGWQEDFNMFCTFPLPSQTMALDYFYKAAERFPGSFILGGHSKGGNLAVYAASFCCDALRERIEAVYSMDAPGFDSKAIAESGFDAIRDKIHTYVPQSSVFGMMFEHQESYTVIRSTQKGFFQHDVYSWEIERTSLVRLSEVNGTSAFFDHTLSDFVGRLTVEERQTLTEAVFRILKQTDDKTFNEIAENWFRDTGVILKSLKGLPSGERKLIATNLLRLMQCAAGNFSDLRPLRKKGKKQHL